MINMIEKQETILLQAAKAGDSEAFGYLYDNCIKRLYDFVYFKTLNKDLAEDLVSETFIKTLKNIKSCQDNFSSWIFAIARNSIIDHYRRHHEESIEDAWEIAADYDLLKIVGVSLNAEIIKLAMTNLSSEERDIIILRFWQDLPFKEIAVLIGKKEGAVKMSLKRSLSRLRRLLPPSLAVFLPLALEALKYYGKYGK